MKGAHSILKLDAKENENGRKKKELYMLAY